MSQYITTHMDMWGPSRRPSISPQAFDQIYPNGYNWPGDCVTTSLLEFNFQFPHAPLASALWRVCWQLTQPNGQPVPCPNSSFYLAQLVACDAGPSNLEQLASISSNDNNNQGGAVYVYNRTADVTAAMNALITAGVFKQVGFQISGDSTNRLTIFTSRLELTWQVG